MGSGSSSLTKEQSAILAAELQKAYEVCIKENFEIDIMQSTMTSEYNKVLKRFADEKKHETTTNEENKKPVKSASAEAIKPQKLGGHMRSDSSSRLVNKEGPGIGGTSTKRAPTRRRSFDQAVKKVKEQATIIATMEALVSEKKVAEEAIDSWDSVTTQPFCTVCQMAFKSQPFLDRHVKYSDLHTKNVKKAQGIVDPIPEDVEVAAALTSPSTKGNPIVPSSFMTKQEEGKHYKLLYSGSKFFWRNQRTVILDLYVHLLSQTIEVISFDSDKHKELNRIYLDMDAINDIVEVNITPEFEERKAMLLKEDRFATEQQVAAIKEGLMTNTRLSYILSRLQLGTSQTNATVIEYAKLSGDNYAVRNPLLDAPPIVLVPVNITRRRRTNAEEIEKEMSSLSTDLTQANYEFEKARSLSRDSGALLLRASGQAERIANNVYNASQYWIKRKWFNEIQNPLRKKWVKAIRKVIFRRLVDKTKEVLKAKGVQYVSKTFKWEEAISSKGSPSKKRNSVRAKEV